MSRKGGPVMSDRACLCVVLGQSLGFALMPDHPRESIRLATRTYLDRGGGDFIGFYDWLRDSFGRVIGVRETFGAGFESLVNLIPDRDFLVKTNHPPCVEVFFGRAREYDEGESADQDFLMNLLLVSSDGEVVLTFGVDPEMEEHLPDWIEHGWLRVDEIDQKT